MTQTCSKCDRDLPLDHFNKHRRDCKGCRAATQRAYVARNRDKVRARSKAWRDAGNQRVRHLAMYGITVEQYEAMLEAQGGVCGTCFKPCPTGRNLAVDHDHETGLVRGLLCARCNPGLGYFNDDIEVMERAIQWIKSGGSAAALGIND